LKTGELEMTNPSTKIGAAIAVCALAIAAPAGTALAEQVSHRTSSAIRYGAIPVGSYAVVAEVRAKPGMEDKLREATLPLMTQVRDEPQNVVYFLHENRTTPGHFIFYEIFATEADFKAHNATAHVQAWFARLPELAEGGVAVTHMEVRGNAPPQ
jgi:quinol monooxygenase YgiN